MASELEKFSCPLERYIFLEELRSIYDALVLLNPKDSDIFMMRNYDNYKISEICFDHSLTPSKVETSLFNSSKKKHLH